MENVVDGYRRRIGIRSVEFKGKDGFWLNGKPYPSPLIGANRHQDFAVVGNAVANSIHWRDAKATRHRYESHPECSLPSRPRLYGCM